MPSRREWISIEEVIGVRRSAVLDAFALMIDFWREARRGARGARAHLGSGAIAVGVARGRHPDRALEVAIEVRLIVEATLRSDATWRLALLK